MNNGISLTEDNILALRKYSDSDKPIIKQILDNQDELTVFKNLRKMDTESLITLSAENKQFKKRIYDLIEDRQLFIDENSKLNLQLAKIKTLDEDYFITFAGRQKLKEILNSTEHSERSRSES